MNDNRCLKGKRHETKVNGSKVLKGKRRHGGWKQGERENGLREYEVEEEGKIHVRSPGVSFYLVGAT